MNKRIYKGNIVSILYGLSNRDYQENIWLNRNNPRGLVDSFVETVNMLFDDCVVGDYLQEGQILFDRSVTKALIDLHEATDAVNEFRPEEEIVTDPLMRVVREKAARVLALIHASDGRESTVDILD